MGQIGSYIETLVVNPGDIDLEFISFRTNFLGSLPKVKILPAGGGQKPIPEPKLCNFSPMFPPPPWTPSPTVEAFKVGGQSFFHG